MISKQTPAGTACAVGSALAGFEAHWASLAAMLVLGTVLSLFAWDVRRAGGFPNWMLEFGRATRRWGAVLDDISDRRQRRRTRRLEERIKRDLLKRPPR